MENDSAVIFSKSRALPHPRNGDIPATQLLLDWKLTQIRCINCLVSCSSRLKLQMFSMSSCLQRFVHWSSILTSRLVGKVKLVGSTISCEGTFLHGDPTAVYRQNPHVQSYVMATDQVLPPSHHCSLLGCKAAHYSVLVCQFQACTLNSA